MADRRHRILLVEDDRAVAEMYRHELRFTGFEVELASDGVEALRSMERHRPDAIILDLHLPRLRGESVLGEIAANPDLKGIPVIVVTASDARLAIAQARAILCKPCPPDLLLTVLKHSLAA